MYSEGEDSSVDSVEEIEGAYPRSPGPASQEDQDSSRVGQTEVSGGERAGRPGKYIDVEMIPVEDLGEEWFEDTSPGMPGPMHSAGEQLFNPSHQQVVPSGDPFPNQDQARRVEDFDVEMIPIDELEDVARSEERHSDSAEGTRTDGIRGEEVVSREQAARETAQPERDVFDFSAVREVLLMESGEPQGGLFDLSAMRISLMGTAYEISRGTRQG